MSRFSVGIQHPITLISAPAGFGKSSLLAMWIEENSTDPPSGSSFKNIAWLSIDPLDNEPVRFWMYLIHALQSGWMTSQNAADPAFQQNLRSLIHLLQSDPPPDIYSILDALINQILAIDSRILLVLDDYHHIQSVPIHQQVTYLVDHCPANFHLVISTRTDPPLPIARLRARRQLCEFRAADLRFSFSETAQFFQEILKLDLPEQEIEAIENSTEGWIAGLQMAALALQACLMENPREDQNENTLQEKAHAFIASFSGKHVYILDFLADEVFNRQPEEVQAFLLSTSVLERMNAALCDALMQPERLPKDQEHPLPARQILDYLEKANLFLIPLDQERTWYRYHHLFADLLRARLDHLYPHRQRALHQAASAWFRQNGFEEEAIRHALTGEDWEQAASLIEMNIQRFLELGQLSKVLDWIDRLPKEVARRRAGLCLQQAWVMGIAQRQEEFASLLDQAQALLEDPCDAPELDPQAASHLCHQLAILRTYQRVIEGEPQPTAGQINALIRNLPTGSLWEDSWTYWIKAFIYRIMGDFEPAIEALQDALRLCRGKLWVDMVCCTDLGMIYHQQGKLQEAREVFLQGLALRKFHTDANHGYLARLIASLCEVLLDLNQLDEASRYGEMGLAWLKWWPSGNTWSQLYTALGRVRLAKSDLTGASELILRADRDRQTWPLRPINNSQVEDALLRLWLAQGDFQALDQWVKAFNQRNPAGGALQNLADESLLIQQIACSRVLLAQGRAGDPAALVQAERQLSALGTALQNSGRIRYAIEIGILHAGAIQSKCSPDGTRLDPQAITVLKRCLSMGEAGGILQPFLEGDLLIEKMLVAIRSQYDPARLPGFHLPYLHSILAAFQSRQTGTIQSPPGAKISESISEREREVLRLAAAGFSNQAMAEKLVVSEGTIKSHLHHLFGKLDVRSRTQLIAKAKELNLI